MSLIALTQPELLDEFKEIFKKNVKFVKLQILVTKIIISKNFLKYETYTQESLSFKI